MNAIECKTSRSDIGSNGYNVVVIAFLAILLILSFGGATATQAQTASPNSAQSQEQIADASARAQTQNATPDASAAGTTALAATDGSTMVSFGWTGDAPPVLSTW